MVYICIYMRVCGVPSRSKFLSSRTMYVCLCFADLQVKTLLLKGVIIFCDRWRVMFVSLEAIYNSN